jgi:hypothetical protein
VWKFVALVLDSLDFAIVVVLDSLDTATDSVVDSAAVWAIQAFD